MAEAKAKKKFQEVSLRWGNNVSIDQVFSIFKNSEKYTLERQQKLLQQLFKSHAVDFAKIAAQFENDVKKNKKTPYEAFIIFMVNMSLMPQQISKPQIAVKPTSASDSKLSISLKSDSESPALSSSRIVSSYKQEVDVSEVNLENC